MPIPAQLVELRSRLDAAGMIVVEEPDHLTIRLPFFCSVRVYSDGARLRFESFFGVMPRERSTVFKLFGISTVAVASVKFGFGYAGIAALMAVIAGLYDSIRWQVTEHAITRASTLSALASMEVRAPIQMVAYGANPALRAGEASITPPPDRVYVRERRDD